MALTAPCPNPSCRRPNRYDAALGGQAVRCPVCGERYSLAGSTVAMPAGDAGASPDAGRPPGAETVEYSTLAEGAHPRAEAPAMPLAVGRYRIKRTVGSGAFGAVYLAYDPQLDRDVALKVPHPGVLESPTAVDRFLREARAAGRLRHGSIVPVYDAGRDQEGRYYIASAFIPGMTLADVIAEGPLPARRAAELVATLAEALEHAHESGVVHRDVKPTNVLLDAAGVPLIADFGLAQHRGPSDSAITEVGTVMGTPGYMAPEVAAGIRGDVPPASDQYGLGVVLYELLCGRRPFQGPSHVVVYQKIEEDAPPLRRHRADLDPALESICLRALARKPGDRFPSCGAMAAELRRWLQQGAAGPIPAPRPASAPPRPVVPDPEPDPLPSTLGDHLGSGSFDARPRRPGFRIPTFLRTVLVTMTIWGLIIGAIIFLIRWLLAGA